MTDIEKLTKMKGTITLLDKEIVARRLRAFGIKAGAVLGLSGLLYFGTTKVKGIIETHRAYKSVEVALTEKSYSKSKEALDAVRARLDEDEVGELEKRIEEIHPSILAAVAGAVPNYPEKLSLLRIALSEYDLLDDNDETNRIMEEVRREYLETHLLFIASSLHGPTADISGVNGNIAALLGDNLVFKKKENENETVCLVKIATDSMSNRMSDLMPPIRYQFVQNIPAYETLVGLSIELLSAVNPEKKQQYIAEVLGRYGSYIFDSALKETEITNGAKLALLGSLKRLEEKFNYKIPDKDTDAAIVSIVRKEEAITR